MDGWMDGWGGGRKERREKGGNTGSIFESSGGQGRNRPQCSTRTPSRRVASHSCGSDCS
uniref:Alternative protein SLC6A17 n=1 Tax=Homo sapiens TaxID=9606 RepID=L8E704_HUMAN|nr:alternative protein SLC6A17 [Homo sapiens]